MTDIRALTIRQPWAGAIVHQAKRVENRTWPIPAALFGARILIHAARQPDRDAIVHGPNLDVYGAIIGTATLAGCHYDTGAQPCCSEWALANTYHWQLTDVVALAEPIPAKGALGLWRPSPELAAEVLGVPTIQLAEER